MRSSAMAVAVGLAASVALAFAVNAATMAPDEVAIVGNAIPEPLTDEPGDPLRGELIARDASNATCLICHQMPIPDEPNPGNIGPDLAGIANRYTEGELRLRIVNPKVVNPNTVMPAYYVLDGLNQVEAQYRGTTIYSAQDVEDVLAFLMTLTEPAP